MKKIIIMSLSLLAVTLCANCGGGGNCTFIFNGENCTLNNQSSYKEDKQNPINLTLTANGDDYYLPNDISVLIGSKRGAVNTDYTYALNDDRKTANLSLCVSDAFGYQIRTYVFMVVGSIEDLNYDETTKKYSVIKYVQGEDTTLTLSFSRGSLIQFIFEIKNGRTITFDYAYAVEEPAVPD